MVRHTITLVPNFFSRMRARTARTAMAIPTAGKTSSAFGQSGSPAAQSARNPQLNTFPTIANPISIPDARDHHQAGPERWSIAHSRTSARARLGSSPLKRLSDSMSTSASCAP